MRNPRRRRPGLGSGLQAALLAGLLIFGGGALPARADDGSGAGWGVGSALTSLVYAPVKVAYAGVGLLFGGLGWALSGGDPAVARAAIAPAVGGDYVVTPAHLRGERRLVFVAVEPPRTDPDPYGYADLEADEDYGYEAPVWGEAEDGRDAQERSRSSWRD